MDDLAYLTLRRYCSSQNPVGNYELRAKELYDQILEKSLSDWSVWIKLEKQEN